MVKIPSLPATKLVEAVSGTVLQGKADFELHHLAEPSGANADGVAFVISEAYLKEVPSTKAGTLVVQAAFVEKLKGLIPASVKLLVSSPDAYLGLAQFSKVVADADRYADWRFEKASQATHIHERAEVDPTVQIAPGVVVCERAVIGARTVILPNAVVGPEARIGSDCVIFPGVVIYPRTEIGNRVRIHANTVLGSDGFGYARGPRGSVKIWHLGRVIIGDDVEVGAGSMIDRGTMNNTIVESGAKIDNLVQIGHNGHVKAHAILCAQVGMAGNVTIGQGAILAGKVGIADKLEIGDRAIVGPMAGLSKDVAPGEIIMGSHPGKPRREWWKIMALVDRLPELYERVKKLEGGRKA